MSFDPKTYEEDETFKTYISTQISEATESLANTNKGLLGDITKMKKQFKPFENVDLESLQKAAKELKILQDKSNENESEYEKALRIQKEQFESKIQQTENNIEILMNQNKTLLVEGDLMTNLQKINVKSDLIDSAVRILKPDVSVLVEEGKQIARIGDKTIGEAVKDWASTPAGKHFILAKNNSGGGGGGGTVDTKHESAKYFEKVDGKKGKFYNITQQLRIKKSDPELYNELKKVYE